MSSNRPINGDTKVAPHFAAIKACVTEKHKVTFVFTFFFESSEHALRPS